MVTQHMFKTVLPNGLRVITVPMPGVKSATVMIMVGAGSRYETKRTNGLSHFLEHMAFKGTEKRPTALHISSEIDSIGGEFNAFTSKDHTGFYIKAQATHVPQLIEVLSDMLLHSLFKEEEIEREKGVIIEEINMYEDTPMRKIGDIFETLLYGNHPLGWEIAGTKESVTGVTRNDFVNYVNDVYSPNNAVVLVAGGVTQKSVESHVKKYLKDWKRKKVISFETFKNDTNPGNMPQVKVVFKDTEQSHLVLGLRGYKIGHPKRYAEGLLAAILGGGMSSRLFIEVRERRGLAYYVHASTERYTDVGSFTIQAGVDIKRIDDAIRVILQELRRIADEKNGILPAELKKAKEFIKGRTVLEMEDSRAVAGTYATQEILEHKLQSVDETLDKIDAVSAAQIQSVARELFVNKKLNLAVIGPFKDSKRFEKLLKF